MRGRPGPGTLGGMTYRFQSFDGTSIAYQDWGPRAQTPPVVLHHGFIADATTNWVGPGIVDALVAAGRRVVAPDARGHGASDKPHDPGRYGEEAMVLDLTALLGELDVAHADLVGYSMGGVVAAAAATRDARIRRLVVAGVGASLAELGGVDRTAVPTAEVRAALLAEDPATVRLSPAAGFRQLADAIGADRVALAAVASAGRPRTIALDRITVPTLVLCGKDDLLATRPEVLAAAIPGAVLRVVPGDHLSAVREPEFVASIVDFLTPDRAG